MVTTLMGLTRSGLRDWYVQRISAVILATYFLFLLGFIFMHPQLNFDNWQRLFANDFMRMFSLLALLSLIGHAWIGVWTVVTDYVSWPWIRNFLNTVIILALIVYLAWGIETIWGL